MALLFIGSYWLLAGSGGSRDATGLVWEATDFLSKSMFAKGLAFGGSQLSVGGSQLSVGRDQARVHHRLRTVFPGPAGPMVWSVGRRAEASKNTSEPRIV